MKALFIGGIKSGKSTNAEIYTLKHSKAKPTYLATTEFFDDEMKEKIKKHQLQRGNNFDTLEEPLQLSQVQTPTDSMVLVECVSMWINNMLYHQHSEESMIKEIDRLCSLHNNIVFVINDVSQSVVSDNPLTRKFVNINGIIAQNLAKKCDEVYNTVAGISIRIK